jgi:hypothetical protein
VCAAQACARKVAPYCLTQGRKGAKKKNGDLARSYKEGSGRKCRLGENRRGAPSWSPAAANYQSHALFVSSFEIFFFAPLREIFPSPHLASKRTLTFT